ncbi:MAG TPA: TrmH family RNA methyltransferase [Fibrobacteraceae bacterium]|nr:TrmH family RNA methyltransferase [Fibrobacteraceae bacterium]
MGFSREKFLALPERQRAKKMADLLRVILLRLGGDWKQALSDYDRMVDWFGKEAEPWKVGASLQHPRLLEAYQFWRAQTGLGPQRDVYLQQEPGDLDQPLSVSLEWSVLAHNLRSAYNVGSLFRTMDCFGLGTLHLSGYTPDPTHAALRSAARGAESWIPYRRWDSPLDCLQEYRRQGIPVIALETGPDSIALTDFPWTRQGVLVLGNEELGVAPELLKFCDQKVCIPMYGRKASLNVASAFAVVAHQLRLPCYSA